MVTVCEERRAGWGIRTHVWSQCSEGQSQGGKRRDWAAGGGLCVLLPDLASSIPTQTSRLPSHHLATKPGCLLPVGFQSFPYTEFGVDEPHLELKNHAETELPHASANWGRVQVF